MSDNEKDEGKVEKILNGVFKTLDIVMSVFELGEAIIGAVDSVNNVKYSAENLKSNFSNNENEEGD